MFYQRGSYKRDATRDGVTVGKYAMRVRHANDLLLLNILVVLLIIIIAFIPSSVFRIIIGLPFVVFFPGYALAAALFPKRTTLETLERVALSFGLSIAVTPLMGLILNYTPWGIRLYPIVISFSIFIFAISVIAWCRRQRLAEAERFTVSFNLNLAPWMGQSLAEKILSGIIIMTMVGAIGAVGYAIATPKGGGSLTEFYILGLEGKAENYPKEVTVGQEARVIVGIINREGEAASYQIEVTIDGLKNNEVGPVVLTDGEKWEEEVSITPLKVGEKQKVVFVLYKAGETYRQLHLWLDVLW